MRINTNINSMRTQEYMRQNQDKMNVSMNRLSSGKRINSAADDAAGLCYRNSYACSSKWFRKASQNTQDGMSLIRTAESAMNSVSNILTRMRDIAVQSSNGTNTDKTNLLYKKSSQNYKSKLTTLQITLNSMTKPISWHCCNYNWFYSRHWHRN